MKNKYICPIKTEYTPTTWDKLIEFTKTIQKGDKSNEQYTAIDLTRLELDLEGYGGYE